MKHEIDDDEGTRHLAANLVTTWVMGAMLLIGTAFFAQFPETRAPTSLAVAAR